MAKTDWATVNCDVLAGMDLRESFSQLGVEILGHEPNAEGWIEARAVGRTDNNPSASVNLATGRYKDFGGEGLSLNIFDLAAKLGRFPDWKEARKFYAAAAGVHLPGGRPPVEPTTHLDFREWNLGMIGPWCLTKPPISPEAVQAFGGRFGYYREMFPIVAVPVLGALGDNGDPVGWVIWEACGRQLPVYGKGGDVRWVKMKTTAGSQAGLIGLHAIREAASAVDPATQTIWKVEGPGDALALYSMIPPELRNVHLVVTNAGGAGEHPKASMAAPFTGRHGIVLHDTDEPGEAGVRDKWQPWMAGLCLDVRQVRLPYEIQPTHGKDVRDYFNDGHTFFDLLALADEATPVSAATTPYVPRLIEADDDPHRLARLFLERNGGHEDGFTWRAWQGEFWRWQKIYRTCQDTDAKGILTAAIKAEFDRINIEEQATADGDKLPEVRRVTQGLLGNVIGALQSTVLVQRVSQKRDDWFDPIL